MQRAICVPGYSLELFVLFLITVYKHMYSACDSPQITAVVYQTVQVKMMLLLEEPDSTDDITSSFLSWSGSQFVRFRGCSSTTPTIWGGNVFLAAVNTGVSKTGALINFSSGETPFLEVQWPSKCAVASFFLSRIIHGCFSRSCCSSTDPHVFVHTTYP